MAYTMRGCGDTRQTSADNGDARGIFPSQRSWRRGSRGEDESEDSLHKKVEGCKYIDVYVCDGMLDTF